MDEVRIVREDVDKNTPGSGAAAGCGCGMASGAEDVLDTGMKFASELEKDAVMLETINVRLSWMERRRLEQELDGFNLTMPQYMTLRCVLKSPAGCSMTELAESSHQLSATMTGIVDRLAERGLVQRERDPRDRRALRVMLTQEGKQLMEKVSERKHARMVALLAALTPEERRTMIEMSRRYLSLVEESLRLEQAPQGANES